MLNSPQVIRHVDLFFTDLACPTSHVPFHLCFILSKIYHLMLQCSMRKLSPSQIDLLGRLENPTTVVETVLQANGIGHDDPLLIKETGEIRLVNIYNGVSVTSTLEALKKRGYLDFRIEGTGIYRRFYIKLSGGL